MGEVTLEPRPAIDHFSPVLEPVAGKVLAVAENAIHFTFRWPEITINLFFFVVGAEVDKGCILYLYPQE